VTSQLPVEEHVTTAWSPTVGVHSPTFVHVSAQPAPQVVVQLLVREHATVHASPHVAVQLWPSEHSILQWSVHFALQSLPKLVHVGEHDDAEPQSSGHDSTLLHVHDEPVQSGVDWHASAGARRTAAASRCRIKAP
jgi:hypothetical protein